jgi:hypothetical protein
VVLGASEGRVASVVRAVRVVVFSTATQAQAETVAMVVRAVRVAREEQDQMVFLW